MLNVGLPEITIILVAALLLLGPKKLPEFARWVGRALREFRQVTNELRTTIDLELEREEFERLQQEFSSTIDPSLIEDALQPPDTPPEPVLQSILEEAQQTQEDSESLEDSNSAEPQDSVDTTQSSQPVVDGLPIITGPPPGTISRSDVDWDDDEDSQEASSETDTTEADSDAQVEESAPEDSTTKQTSTTPEV